MRWWLGYVIMLWTLEEGIDGKYTYMKRGSTAARLVGLRVRISPGSWMFVLCVLYSKAKKAQPRQTKQRRTVKIQRTPQKNPAGGHGYLSLVSVVCCQVEVSATGRSLAQRILTDCDVSYVWCRNLEHEASLACVGLFHHTDKNKFTKKQFTVFLWLNFVEIFLVCRLFIVKMVKCQIFMQDFCKMYSYMCCNAIVYV